MRIINFIRLPYSKREKERMKKIDEKMKRDQGEFDPCHKSRLRENEDSFSLTEMC